jgi:ankyrin repeat protein
MRFLLANGEALKSLGDAVNHSLAPTGETPLHSALSTTNRLTHDLVVKVLLVNGAKPNCATKPNVETGSFMRDCRTNGETPLHHAVAFGNEETTQLLLDAGATVDAPSP